MRRVSDGACAGMAAWSASDDELFVVGGQIARGEVRAVQQWLNKGAPVDANLGMGMTGLMTAAMEGEVAVMKEFLARGAVVDARSGLGTLHPHLPRRSASPH